MQLRSVDAGVHDGVSWDTLNEVDDVHDDDISGALWNTKLVGQDSECISSRLESMREFPATRTFGIPNVSVSWVDVNTGDDHARVPIAISRT